MIRFLSYLLTIHCVLSATGYVVFDQADVELVESHHHRLHRGPMPRNEAGEFCIDELIAALEPLPEKYNLILFSLLTKEREEEIAFMEKLKGYFFVNCQDELSMKTPFYYPLRGTLFWWQVKAHFKDTSGGVKAIEEQKFDKIALEFPRLIETLFAYMNEESDVPNIIYVHCRHGVNRTSAVMMGYEMYAKGASLEKAWATHAQGRQIYRPGEMQAFLKLYQSYLEKVD